MRFFNKCFIFIFLLMLVLPLVFIDLSSDRVSTQENRKLAERPKLSENKNHLEIFFRQFDNWFNDSTGFREILIKIHKKANRAYGVFGQGIYLDGSSVVLIGKHGHHFHTHYNQLLPIWQGKRWLDDDQSFELSNKLDSINRYLKEKKIPFIFMLCTDKESIYPEYYPDFVIKGPEPTPLDAVVNYISTHTNIDFFCIKENLLREKRDWLLYPKTGSFSDLCHYNETGAFIAYRELMMHINKYFPNIKPFKFDDMDITYYKTGTSSVTLKQEKKYKEIEGRFFNDAIEFENEDSNLPTLLFFHDSYADWFNNYLPQHFGRTIMHHCNSLDRLKECIELYKPDIVVFESAERAIPDFASFVAGIPELP